MSALKIKFKCKLKKKHLEYQSLFNIWGPTQVNSDISNLVYHLPISCLHKTSQFYQTARQSFLLPDADQISPLSGDTGTENNSALVHHSFPWTLRSHFSFDMFHIQLSSLIYKAILIQKKFSRKSFKWIKSLVPVLQICVNICTYIHICV